jgi:hypothetical protein
VLRNEVLTPVIHRMGPAKFAKFPVIFPVSREFERRRFRTSLCPPPSSLRCFLWPQYCRKILEFPPKLAGMQCSGTLWLPKTLSALKSLQLAASG